MLDEEVSSLRFDFDKSRFELGSAERSKSELDPFSGKGAFDPALGGRFKLGPFGVFERPGLARRTLCI